MDIGGISPVATVLLSCLVSFLGYRCLICVFTAWREVKRILHIRRTLPGPKPHWLFGNVLQQPGPLTPGLEWHRNMAKTYPRLHVFWAGWKPVVGLNHPDSIRKILTDSVGTVKSSLYGLFEEWLGRSMPLTDGYLWKRHRKLITGTFHFNALKNNIPKINQVAETLVSVIAQRCEEGKPLEVYKSMSSFSSDVILQCAFSYKSDCQKVESQFVQSSHSLTDIIAKRYRCKTETRSPVLPFEFIFRRSSLYKPWRKGINVLHEYIEKIISERREEHKTRGSNLEYFKGMDLLDTVMLSKDSEGGLTDEEIRDEANTFLLAGIDTTSSALTWLLYLLATHPEYQTKVQEEVDELFKDRTNREIYSDDLRNTPFLLKCIKESQRIYSTIAPGRLLTEPLVVDGLTVPAGTEITIYTYQLHHNPDVWGDDLMEFKPSRFDRENVESRDAFAFIPFSAGARNCIGQHFALQEMQIAAIRMFDKFGFTLLQDSIPVFRLVSTPQDEILLGIHPRNEE
ncbi:leukotriene-B4 omega-hydroxylase 3-like [Lytechinus variegatus]|uniref:leukotriene-B4 omega-hydroxylase 3-like n=1 Tax=Lytechinus variegatus TaxID=7654 RepID=UPI001BB2211F|nr:leukotriene-B4 omega-hydroxylase 3-like [Lytechinus variegatus]